MCPNFLIKRVSIRIVCKQKHFKLSILGEPPQNKTVFFFGKVFQNLFTHPPQGFCEIWENEK